MREPPSPTNRNDKQSRPHGRVFEWLSIILYAGLVLEMFRLWTSPEPSDLPRITTLALMMGFEFILVHSAVFMSIMPRKVTVLFLLPIYGIVALALNSGVDNNVILFLYMGLIFTRLRYLFSKPNTAQRARTLKISIISGCIYLGSIAVIAVGENALPRKGLSQDFLNTYNYFESLSVGGVFTQNPHLPLIMGIIYFSLLIVLEIFAHGLLKRRGQKTG